MVLARREEPKSVAGWWYAVIAGVAIVLAFEIFWSIWRAAQPRPVAVRVGDGRPDATPAAGAAEEESAPPARLPPRAPPDDNRPAWATRNLRPMLDRPAAEVRQQLDQQAENLKREARENAGNSNGLTPSPEEIERIIREERVVF